MATRSIRLETRTFAKAGDATAFFSGMLNRYAKGAVVNSADSADLLALLKRHDEMSDKIGAGVSHFEVRAAPDGHPGKCFWIARTDGTFVDFSFPHCLKAKPYD